MCNIILLHSTIHSEARNLSAPHNYVRFFMPSLLRHVRKVVWLDNDVLVLRDIAPMFDATLRDANDDYNASADAGHALAAVVVRRALGDSALRRIASGLDGKPFGRAVGGKRPRSIK